MRFRNPLSTSLAAVCLLLAIVPALVAKTVKFPADAPAFIFDVPDDWTLDQKSDSPVLLCKTASGSGVIVFLSLPNVTSKSELITAMKAWAKASSEEMTEVKISDASDAKSGPGMPLSILTVAAKQDGTPVICVFAGFTPAGGKYFAVSCIAEPAAFKDGGEASAFDAVLDSVKPLT